MLTNRTVSGEWAMNVTGMSDAQIAEAERRHGLVPPPGFPASESGQGPTGGCGGGMEPNADATQAWEFAGPRLTLAEELRRRADCFEQARGGPAGPSLVVLLRDSAAALDERA